MWWKKSDETAPGSAINRLDSDPKPKSWAEKNLLSLGAAVKLSNLRLLFRTNELGLILIAAAIGILSGFVVTGMNLTAQLLHQLIFGIPAGVRLSSVESLPMRVVLVAPVCGGLIIGVLLLILGRWRRRITVDPIEANALHGGQMSLTDSALVALQNLISNGFGASVGLEAGFTQLSSGIASHIGKSFQLRRNDMRTLVGCGAAAAIATAFNAPLTGAFYAFELIIGTYSVATLTPVVVAALAGTFTARLLVGNQVLINVGDFGAIVNADYLPALYLGIICAGFGILIMQGVTYIEVLARRMIVPATVRPMLGGAVVGLLALASPQILSAGHGALRVSLDMPLGVGALAGLIALKSVASAVSIGMGFRGGLFFASLFLGALMGKLFAALVPLMFNAAPLTPTVYAIIGMSSVAVSIIGGPLTMTFLALEMTGDFTITSLVMVAVIASSITVRKTFGYSFAIWRFHLRGEAIRSAVDVGWIRNLTVGKMMRHDVRTIGSDVALAALIQDYPLGSTKRLIVVDRTGRYAGILQATDLHTANLENDEGAANAETLLRFKSSVLYPQMNAREAAAMFEKTASEALAVVDDPTNRRVIGLLTESHTLRRYSEELDRRRGEISGEM